MRKRKPVSDYNFEDHGASKSDLALAKLRRALATSEEVALWGALKRRQLGGWKFQRQQVLVGHIVCFYCDELRLVVEVDGPRDDETRAEGLQQDAALAGVGVDTLRVRDVDVRNAFAAVLAALSARCELLADRRGGELDDQSVSKLESLN